VLRFNGAHESAIERVVFSPSGDLAASIDATWHILIWSLKDGRLLRSFVTIGGIRAAHFSPDGSKLGVVTHTGAAIYEVSTAERLIRVDGSERVTQLKEGTIALSPKLDLIATAREDDGKITLQSADGPVLHVFDTADKGALIDSWSGDGSTLSVTTTNLSRLLLFDTASFTSKQSLHRQRDLRLSPDGKRGLLFGVATGQLLDLEATKPVTLAGFRAETGTFRPDGARAMLARFVDRGGDYVSIEYEFLATKPWRKIGSTSTWTDIGSPFSLDCAWGDDGNPIIRDGVKLISFDPGTKKGKTIGTLPLPAQLSPTCKHAAIFQGQDLRIIQTSTGQDVLRSVGGPRGAVRDLAFSSDGARLAAARLTPKGDVISLWDLADSIPPKLVSPADSALRFGLDDTIIGGEARGTIRILDLTTGLERGSFQPKDFSFGPRGHVHLEDLPSSRPKRSLYSHGRSVALPSSIDAISGWSADGKHVVVPMDPDFGIYDTVTGALEARCPIGPLSGLFEAISLSPDGKRIAASEMVPTSGTSDTYLWDVATCKSKKIAPGTFLPAFSADGNVIILSSRSVNTVALLDGHDGSVIGRFALSPSVVNWTSFATRDLAAMLTAENARNTAPIDVALARIPMDRAVSVALRSDGALLAIAELPKNLSDPVTSGDIQLCRANEGKCIRLVDGAQGGYNAIAVAEDGSFDGPDAALATIQVERASGTTPALEDAFRRPGLLRDFVKAAK
jgi:WD40 repeat protein